jgi:hypothetical protein
MEQPRARKPFPIKKIIGVSLIVVIIIGSIVWLSPIIISSIQNYGYTRVTINNFTAATVKLGNRSYIFEYSPPELAIIPVGAIIYQVSQGATYTYSALEVKILEVHSDYIVLLVKQL